MLNKWGAKPSAAMPTAQRVKRSESTFFFLLLFAHGGAGLPAYKARVGAGVGKDQVGVTLRPVLPVLHVVQRCEGGHRYEAPAECKTKRANRRTVGRTGDGVCARDAAVWKTMEGKKEEKKKSRVVQME